MNTIRNLLNTEPVIIRAVLVIAVTVLARYGFDLDVDSILATVTVLVGAGAVDARRKVTPGDKASAH